MQEGQKIKPTNQTLFSADEIEMYTSQLKRSHGANTRAILLSGLTEQTYYRALRGCPLSFGTKKKLVHAMTKTIKEIQKLQKTASA